MTLEQLCWLSTAAYGVHVLEEFAFDWKNWARSVLRLPVEWNTFYVTNALVIVLGIVSAELASALPTLALAFPALMLINATFFHVAPFLWTRGRFSPGLFTALLLFYPIGFACFFVAARDFSLRPASLLASFGLGAVLMATPVLFLKAFRWRYFQQADDEP